MSIPDEIERLKVLYEAGTLSREEFELAKHKVLSGTAQSENLDEIRIQNQIAQLDREWELERENYMATGKYGRKYIPGKVESAIGGIFLVCFGIFWTIMAANIAANITGYGAAPVFGVASIIFPLFGVCFIIFGAVVSIRNFVKAGEYQQAYQRYQQRRQDLVRQQNYR